jgi:hypothetical protein
MDASDSLARVVAPLLAGGMMQYVSLAAPLWTGAVACAAGAVILPVVLAVPTSRTRGGAEGKKDK